MQNALRTIIEHGVIPIVNENDTVAIDELELEIGENDSLAATIATIAHADLLVILSDIDGLYDTDPRQNQDAHQNAQRRGDDLHRLWILLRMKFGIWQAVPAASWAAVE